jgi:hypothetical protein
MIKNRLLNLKQLFLPSNLGMAIYLMIAIATLYESYYTKNHQLLNGYNDLFRNNNFFHELSKHWDKIVGSTVANTTALWVFWVIVGIAICVVAFFIIGNFEQFDEALKERKYIRPKNANSYRPLINFVALSIFRLAIAVGLVIYVKWLITYLLSVLNSPSATIMTHVILIIKEIILLHLLVVLLRLLTLRKRLFSNQ